MFCPEQGRLPHRREHGGANAGLPVSIGPSGVDSSQVDGGLRRTGLRKMSPPPHTQPAAPSPGRKEIQWVPEGEARAPGLRARRPTRGYGGGRPMAGAALDLVGPGGRGPGFAGAGPPRLLASEPAVSGRGRQSLGRSSSMPSGMLAPRHFVSSSKLTKNRNLNLHARTKFNLAGPVSQPAQTRRPTPHFHMGFRLGRLVCAAFSAFASFLCFRATCVGFGALVPSS